MMISQDPWLYVETIFVCSLAGVARFAIEPWSAARARVATSPRRAPPCGVYAGLFLIFAIFTSLASTAAAGSMAAFLNMLLNAPLVYGACITALGVAERVAAAQLLTNLSNAFVVLRGLLALAIPPWLVRVADHNVFTPTMDLQRRVAAWPMPATTVVFVVLPMSLQVIAFGGSKTHTFAQGVLGTVALLALTAAMCSAMDLPYPVATASVGLHAAIVATESTHLIRTVASGASPTGYAASVGALLSSIAAPLFPITVAIGCQYLLLCAACVLLHARRPRAWSDRGVTSAASFYAVALSTRITAGVAAQLSGGLNVISLSASGVVGLCALYASYVLYAPADQAAAKDAATDGHPEH